MFAKRPDVRVAFSKIHRKGFQELVLPVQEGRLGEPTIPAMVKRELSKNNRYISAPSQSYYHTFYVIGNVPVLV